MLSKKIESALNAQVNEELFSSYIYLSMSAYFESVSLKGHANWMRMQAKEELVHAMKFYDYINERGGKVILDKIKAPKIKWKSPLDAFEDAYEHEQYITNKINKLVDLAMSQKDHATSSMLKWFIDEQVEEEASADEIVQKLKLAKNSPNAILMLDQELSKRVFTPPQTEK